MCVECLFCGSVFAGFLVFCFCAAALICGCVPVLVCPPAVAESGREKERERERERERARDEWLGGAERERLHKPPRRELNPACKMNKACVTATARLVP